MASEITSPIFKIERIDAQNLQDFPRLSELKTMIGDGFSHSVNKHSFILTPGAESYLQSEERLLDRLGPDAVLFLMTVRTPNGRANGDIIATASYKPYEKSWPLRTICDDEGKKAWKTAERRNMTEDDIPAVQEALALLARADSREEISGYPMEIVTVVTSPEWQGYGLASRLVQQITEEVKARAREVEVEMWKPIFKLMVRTVQEVNEPFWSKMGFRTIRSNFFEPGLSGRVEGFHLLEMVREHAIA